MAKYTVYFYEIQSQPETVEASSEAEAEAKAIQLMLDNNDPLVLRTHKWKKKQVPKSTNI